jgi:phospholipid/cholesterol/gamma-HCH transport system substrate-binding protein
MRPESKVGLVVLVFLMFVFYFSFKIGGDRLPWQEDKGYILSVLFDNISGLEPKSLVRYAGVEVGVVDSIELENGKAKVTLKLNPDIQIHRDAVIEVGSMGLMGEKFVMIKGGSPGAPFLDGTMSVEGQAPVSMDQLVVALNAIGEDFKAITGSLREAIGVDNQQNRVSDILVNIDRLTATLADLSEDNDQKFDDVLTNFSVITSDLRAIVQDNRSDLRGTVENLHEVVGALADSMPAISSDHG